MTTMGWTATMITRTGLLWLLLLKYHQSSAFAPSSSCTARRSSIHLNGWFDSLFPQPVDASSSSTSREQEYPEQYPATLEANTIQIPSEEGEAKLVRVLLKNTQLESRPLKVVYDANNPLQGYNAKAFHRAVDGKGAAIVLAKANGEWVGAYNPKGWASTGGARPSVAAFLFYSRGNELKKLRKIGGGGLACAKDDPSTGIWMGADGLIIPFEGDGSRQQLAYSKLGTYFQRGPDQLSSLFSESSARLTDLKVLVGVYEAGEEIPYSGAVLDFTSG